MYRIYYVIYVLYIILYISLRNIDSIFYYVSLLFLQLIFNLFIIICTGFIHLLNTI